MMRRATAIALALLLAGCSAKREPAPAARGITRFESLALSPRTAPGNSLPATHALFAASDTVYAFVATRGAGGAAVAVSCTEETGQPVDASTQLSPAGGGVSLFRFAPPRGWRTGRYVVQVLVDGVLAETRSFQAY